MIYRLLGIISVPKPPPKQLIMWDKVQYRRTVIIFFSILSRKKGGRSFRYLRFPKMPIEVFSGRKPRYLWSFFRSIAAKDEVGMLRLKAWVFLLVFVSGLWLRRKISAGLNALRCVRC